MVLQVGQECLGGKVERIMEPPLHSPQSDSWGRWVGCLPAVNQASDQRHPACSQGKHPLRLQTWREEEGKEGGAREEGG